MDHVSPSRQYDVMKVRQFLSITKPGIILGNLMTVMGSYFLGTRGAFHFERFSLLIIGISFVIASGCVFNNLIDKDIDGVMERTQGRVLVQGLIPDWQAFSYASILGVVGFWCLLRINGVSFSFALMGWIFYVVVYSLWAKRKSIYGTVLGSMAGAMPMAVGYCAGVDRIDLGLLVLILISIFWQIPHSYAIGLFRGEDYKKANIPIFSVIYEPIKVQKHCLMYIIIFTLLCASLYALGYTGKEYLYVMMLLCFYWLWLTVRGFNMLEVRLWARKMFVFSIVIIFSFSLLIGFNY